MRRWLVAGGALAAIQMVVYTSVAEAVRPGFEARRNWISQLALGSGGWLAALNLALCGVWLLLAAEGLRYRFGPVRVARLIRWCGLCFLVLAAFPTDPGIGYPPDVTPAFTASGAVHRVVGLVLATVGVLASVELGRCLPGRSWARPAGWTVAVVMAVTFTVAGVLVALDTSGLLPGAPSGLFERTALYAGLGWIGVAGLFAVRQSGSFR